MNALTILVVDPLSHSRDIISSTLTKRFTVVQVSNREQAKELLQHEGIDLVLLSGYQSKGNGRSTAKSIKKALGDLCPPLWHYGEVDGVSRLPNEQAAELSKRFSIDKFLTGSMSPQDITRSVALHFRDRILASEKAQRGAYNIEVRSARVENPNPTDRKWSEIFGSEVSAEVLKQAMKKPVIDPVEELTDEATWNEILRSKVTLRHLWMALNTDLITPVEVSDDPSWKELLAAQASLKTLGTALTKDVVEPVEEIPDPARFTELLRTKVTPQNMWRLLTLDVRVQLPG